MWLLKHNLEITKYLSTLRPHNFWWMGATNASIIASNVGEFVWLTDNADVDHISNHLIAKPLLDHSNESQDRYLIVWGQTIGLIRLIGVYLLSICDVVYNFSNLKSILF